MFSRCPWLCDSSCYSRPSGSFPHTCAEPPLPRETSPCPSTQPNVPGKILPLWHCVSLATPDGHCVSLHCCQHTGSPCPSLSPSPSFPPPCLAGEHQDCWWRCWEVSSPPKGTVPPRQAMLPKHHLQLQAVQPNLSQEAMSVHVWQDRQMGLSLPRELFVTDLKNVSPWEVNVSPALAGVPAHPRRIRCFSLLIPSQQQRPNAAFMPGRKWKPITLQWMLQCEAAREKQTHVLYLTPHIPFHVPHSTLQPTRVPCPIETPGEPTRRWRMGSSCPQPVCGSPASHPH